MTLGYFGQFRAGNSRMLGALAAAAAGSAEAPMAEAHERANAEYKAGVTFFNREDYASAEPRFRAALAIAPIFPEPNYALGQVRPCQPSPPPSAPSPVAPAEYSPLSSAWRQLLLRTQRHAEARHHLDAAASLVEASKAAAARADLTSRENLGRREYATRRALPSRASLPLSASSASCGHVTGCAARTCSASSRCAK